MRKLLFCTIFLFAAGCFGGKVATVNNATAEEVAVTPAPAPTAPEVVGVIDTLKKLPDMKAGIMYDFRNHEVVGLSTTQLWRSKNKKFDLEAGYAVDNTVVGVVSYQIATLKELGVDLPILDLVEFNVGLGGGYKYVDQTIEHGKNTFKYGVTLTLINWKV